MERRFVFLDPDGTSDLGLILLVLAPTGVEYQTQAAGLLTEPHTGEGFLIPLDRRDLEAKLMHFFQTEFRGHSYAPEAVWTVDRLTGLELLLREIPAWETRRDCSTVFDARPNAARRVDGSLDSRRVALRTRGAPVQEL